MIPYEQAGVSIADGQVLNFELEPIDRELIEMVTIAAIPGGTFLMGEEGNTVYPSHQVTLSPFEMSTHEITQAQYQYVMGKNPSFHVGAAYPVEQVSWHDAAMFCNMMSYKTGLQRCYDESTWECDFSKNGYRLPTEAEWEYACRAGTTTRFYTGDDLSPDETVSADLDAAAWYWENSWVDGNYGTTHETKTVGTRAPNAWGLYDMHGNVYEWCNDWYDRLYYENSPELDPQGAEYDPDHGINGKAGRGGSVMSGATACQVFVRFKAAPASFDAGRGFRIVRRP
jgi:formylglycine-generating enzyme required for sulfatase activity